MTLSDELESARLEYLAAESRWRSLLRQHDIAENRVLVGKFFYGYVHDRDCTRCISVTDIDVSGRLVGDVITFWDDSIEFAQASSIRDGDLDTMDEITALEYLAKLSEILDALEAAVRRLS